MLTEKDVNKPEPIAVREEIMTFNQESDIELFIGSLKKGEPVLINRLYSDGLELLKKLHWYLKQKLPNKTLQEQQAYDVELQKLFILFFLEVVVQKLIVRNASS